LGFDNSIGILYSQVLASCYDPHTVFLPQSLKDAFEGHLGKKSLEFGLALDEDENGNTRISELKPGSAAYQSGQLNEGDKIKSVQWQDREPIDVSAASQEEVGEILSAAGGNKAVLTVQKADGTSRQVTLHKTVAAMEDEEEKVKSLFCREPKRSVIYRCLLFIWIGKTAPALTAAPMMWPKRSSN
jgi:carboxyl-terminal processing protease